MPAVDVWQLGGDAVTSVRLSALPYRVVTCGSDTACVLTEDGHVVRIRYDDGSVASDITLAGDVQPAMAASADGARIAVAMRSGLVEIVDPATGASVGTLTGGSQNAVPLSFSPDGKRLAGADVDTVLVWR